MPRDFLRTKASRLERVQNSLKGHESVLLLLLVARIQKRRQNVFKKGVYPKEKQGVAGGGRVSPS